MDMYKRLLELEMIKRFKDEEDEIYESLNDKYKNYEVIKKEYLDLYENLTDLVISVQQVQTILTVSNLLNEEILSENQITDSDEQKIAKILKRPYFDYLPEINLSNIKKISVSTKLILKIFDYIQRNKHLLNHITSQIKKSENNMLTLTPLTFDCLLDYFKIEFVPDSEK